MKAKEAIDHFNQLERIYASIARLISASGSSQTTAWDQVQASMDEARGIQNTLEMDPAQVDSAQENEDLAAAAERASHAHKNIGPLLQEARSGMLAAMAQHGRGAAATKLYRHIEQPLPRFVDRQG